MFRRPVILTTMQEDFRAIGLLAEDEVIDEVDNPQNPRDIPSPDPSTMSGLDNSAGKGNSSAKHDTANQPKPAMAPSDKKDHEDPLQAGGAQKGKLRGAGHKAGDMRETKDGYKDQNGQILPKAADQGKNPDKAGGLKPVKKHAGMSEGDFGQTAFERAVGLVAEVGDILKGIGINEEYHAILRGVRLVAENSALLADRLIEISEGFEVDESVSAMEDLSEDAAELYGIIEMNLDGHKGEEEEERAAVRNSKAAQESRGSSDRDPTKPYDVPSPAFKEQVEEMLGVMVGQFMEHLKAYDEALSEMSNGDDDKDKDKSGDDDKDKNGDNGNGDDDGNGKGRMSSKFDKMREKFRGGKK